MASERKRKSRSTQSSETSEGEEVKPEEVPVKRRAEK